MCFYFLWVNSLSYATTIASSLLSIRHLRQRLENTKAPTLRDIKLNKLYEKGDRENQIEGNVSQWAT